MAVPDLSPAALDALLQVGQQLRSDTATSVLANSATLSTRQLLRIARRNAAFPGEPLADAVRRACLAQFLPPLARDTLDQLLGDVGATAPGAIPEAGELRAVITEAADGSGGRVLDIGGVRAAVREDSNAALVPDVVFYDNPQHLRVMQDMLKDYALGEHLLLVGNQGVGKNKVADRLLQLLNLPREYVQLHRDTTVQTLTQQPSVRQGRIVYDDSPLVRAVAEGSVLVVRGRRTVQSVWAGLLCMSAPIALIVVGCPNFGYTVGIANCCMCMSCRRRMTVGGMCVGVGAYVLLLDNPAAAAQ